MRVIIAGSRTATREHVNAAMALCTFEITSTLCGMAQGADLHGRSWAWERGLTVREFPANWAKFGKRAGPIRNRKMACQADGLVAVWDGLSYGTQSMIRIMEKLKSPIEIYLFSPLCRAANVWRA